MKKTLVATLLFTALSTNLVYAQSANMATDVVCLKLSASKVAIYPLSPKAQRLADKLGVKTCTGKRFKKAVQYNYKTTIKIKKATKAEEEAYYKKEALKLDL